MSNERHGSGAVLVVDDDEMIRRLVPRLLAQWSFSALVASDGIEAVDLLGAHTGEIICVVLDLKMPRMGGEETFTLIREMGYDVPVVLMSGYGEPESTTGFSHGDLAGFLQKPFSAESLQEQLRKVLGGTR